MVVLASPGRPDQLMNGSGQLRLISGRRLLSPRGSATRPTTARVREAVMNIVRPRLMDCRWLDLCSGSGVMACEAIERGARSVTAVERDPRCASICKRNLEAVATSHAAQTKVKVVKRDVLLWLQQDWQESGFDLIYFDPPYDGGLYQKTLALLGKQPWLEPDGLLICEHRSGQPPSPGEDWTVVDQRRYGTSSLVLISRRERCHRDGTDSRQPRTIQEA